MDADVTMGRDMFRRVAAVAELHKQDFKLADKTPYIYDFKLFDLVGWLEYFQDHTTLCEDGCSRCPPPLGGSVLLVMHLDLPLGHPGHTAQ